MFASGEGDADGLEPGEALDSGLSAGEGSGVSSGDGLGVTLGLGVGDPFLLPLFAEGDGELLGVGVTEASGFGEGEAVGFGELDGFGELVAVGVALAFGEALGFADGVGVGDDFFFVELELFRFFGAGVGSKMSLILSPNDCADAG